MIKIGWIDFSNDDREKAMAVIDMMKDKGAVDELGIGIIRDRLSDILFPGSSTIQTRAKYFFIVPWCFKSVEKRYKKKSDYIKALNNIETKVILKLIENCDDEKGIIGKDSKEKLKRKPSSVYWNGLKTLGIMKSGISISQYIDIIYDKNKNIVEKESDSENDSDSDFLDANNIHWNIIKESDNWIENLNLKLSYEESTFLRNQIISSNPRSLYAVILDKYLNNTLNEENIYSLSFKDELPEDIKSNLELALGFGRIIHGAHIRFNIILREKNEVELGEYEGYWKEWKLEMKNFDFDSFNTNRLFTLTNTTGGTKFFVEKWIEISKNINNMNLMEIDKLIEDREYSLKGARSKIKNYSKVNIENWVGLGELNYRWNRVKVILRDIYEGGLNNA